MTETPLPLIMDIGKQEYARINDPKAKEADTHFAAVRKSILARDANTCQGCGILLATPDKTTGCGLDVHHRNGNPHDNNPDNLISLCPLCHGIFHIGYFARRFGRSMQLIYCPELTQNQCNLLSWSMAMAIWLAKQYPEPDQFSITNKVEIVLASLAARTQVPVDYFDKSAQTEALNASLREESTIAFFATLLGMLRSHEPKAYAEREKWLQGLRIFYNPKAPEPFTDRQGHSLLERLAALPGWQAGPLWVEHWCFIGNNT